MRMKSLLVLLVCAVVGISLGNALNVGGEETNGELCVPLGNIVLSPPEGVEAQRAPVDFPHGLHFSIQCQECHHNWESDDQNLSCMTSGCHDLPSKDEEGQRVESYRYFKEAYHQSCIGCHKAIKANNKALELSKETIVDTLSKSGPTSCVECHPRDE